MAANRFFKDTATFGTVTLGDSLHIQLGNTAMITNVDHSGLAAGGLAEVIVAPDYFANIGTSSSPFKAELATGKGLVTNNAGGGTFYLQADSSAGTNVIQKLRVIGDGKQWLVLGGTFTDVMITSSVLICDELVTITNLRASGGLSELRNPGGAGGFLVDLYISGDAEVRCERGVSGEVQQWGGQSFWDALTETIETYILIDGLCDIAECGTITLYEWRGGRLDLRRLSRPLTITALEIWPGVNEEDVAAVLGNTLLSATVTYR